MSTSMRLLVKTKNSNKYHIMYNMIGVYISGCGAIVSTGHIGSDIPCHSIIANRVLLGCSGMLVSDINNYDICPTCLKKHNYNLDQEKIYKDKR